jgi:hypothetical protein
MDLMSRDTWQFINTFAEWLSAIGTIIAVWVALYLAGRDRRIRLVLQASHEIRMIENTSSLQDTISITVTNMERRTATITRVYWKVGIFKKEIFYPYSTGLLDDSSAFPQELRDGEQAHYRYLTKDFLRTVAEFRHYYPRVSRGIFRLSWVRHITIGVETSSGKTFPVGLLALRNQS